jgi:hypothetical protein
VEFAKERRLLIFFCGNAGDTCQEQEGEPPHRKLTESA